MLAVADGAGSARQALLGATRAVSGACEAAVGALLSETVPASDEGWKELLIECVRAGRRAVERAGEPLHELASTLLLAILYGDTLAAAQVGDGWIVAKDGAGECRAVTVPGKGEYFNETVFVTSREYLETCSLRVEKASGLRGVAVLSDGLETAACDLAAGSPYAGFFDPLFRFAADSAVPKEEKRRRLEEFLSSERINSRTYDDKTLLLAVRDDVGAPSVDEPLPGGARGSDA